LNFSIYFENAGTQLVQLLLSKNYFLQS